MTDPDCGLFVKGGHRRQFAYEAHTDRNGFVPEAVVTAGNVHDSAALGDVYDKVTEAYPEIEAVAADSAYKTPRICCVLCPECQPLRYSTTNRDGYRELYARRRQTIEWVFADAREKHAMRYTQYRGLTRVTNWVKLKFAAMNLKQLAKWKPRTSLSHKRPGLRCGVIPVLRQPEPADSLKSADFFNKDVKGNQSDAGHAS